MLSRHAESFYWLSRNIERAETVARVVDVSRTRAMDLDAGPVLTARLWRTAVALGTPARPAGMRADELSAQAVVAGCVADPANSSSIVSTVGIARANAIALRAELSTETWEHVNALYLDVSAAVSEPVGADSALPLLRSVRDRCQAIAGVADATLLHVDGWNFLQLGRYVERAYLTVRMLATMESLDDAWPQWQRLLEMSCAAHPFARCSSNTSSPHDAVAFILFNPAFPRSVRFCLEEVDAALHRISERRADGSFANDAEKAAGQLRATVAFTDIGDVVDEGVAAFLGRLDDAIGSLAAAIRRVYFPRVPLAAVPLERDAVASR